MAKKEDLTAELHRLESEIEALGTAVSDSQIWHKKARIEQIKKELAELESPAGKFNAGTDKLKEMMAAQQPQLTPEQIAELRGGRG
jgi:protein subunit release factor A